MSLRSKKAFAVAVCSGLLVSSWAAMPAAASPNDSSTTASSGAGQDHAKYCAIVVGETPGTNQYSPVLARACSDSSMQEAESELTSQVSTISGVKPLRGTLLVTYWSNANQTGDEANIYAGGSIGDGGTCNRSGYRLALSGWWEDNLSSLEGHYDCNYATFYDSWDWGNWGSSNNWLPANVPGFINDEVDSIQVVYRT